MPGEIAVVLTIWGKLSAPKMKKLVTNLPHEKDVIMMTIKIK